MRKLLLISLVLLNHLAFGQYSGTPLMLSLPMDKDTIEEDEPVFVWQTTLSNVQNDPRLNVQLAVVKMEEDQKKTEAMVENTPVFIRQNLLSSSLNYSSVDHELEESVWYAWQVVLFYNGVQVQQSEVWKFIKSAPVVNLQSYIPLRISNDASIFEIKGNRLNVSTKASGDFSTICTLSNENGKATSVQMQQVISGKFIDSPVSKSTTDTRYFSIDLDALKLKKGYYTFVWNIGQTPYTLNFLMK